MRKESVRRLGALALAVSLAISCASRNVLPVAPDASGGDTRSSVQVDGIAGPAAAMRLGLSFGDIIREMTTALAGQRSLKSTGRATGTRRTTAANDGRNVDQIVDESWTIDYQLPDRWHTIEVQRVGSASTVFENVRISGDSYSRAYASYLSSGSVAWTKSVQGQVRIGPGTLLGSGVLSRLTASKTDAGAPVLCGTTTCWALALEYQTGEGERTVKFATTTYVARDTFLPFKRVTTTTWAEGVTLQEDFDFLAWGAEVAIAAPPATSPVSVPGGFVAAPTQIPTGPGQIVGRILWNGGAIPGIPVRLYPSSAATQDVSKLTPLAATTSAADGSYAISASPGTYRLDFNNSPGNNSAYFWTWYSSWVISAGSRFTLNFALQKSLELVSPRRQTVASPVTVTWKAVDQAASYHVFIFDSTLKAVVSEQTSSTALSVPLQSGIYSYSVQAFSAANAAIAYNSDQFTVR